MSSYIIMFITLIVFVSLDSVYLYSMRHYFQQQIQRIQGTPLQMNITATILCYLTLAFGLYYFIIRPKKNVLDAFLLGLVIYLVYETTTWALFTKWSPLTVLIDSLWGGILFSITTMTVYRIERYIR